jgi:hypothetical protein
LYFSYPAVKPSIKQNKTNLRFFRLALLSVDRTYPVWTSASALREILGCSLAAKLQTLICTFSFYFYSLANKIIYADRLINRPQVYFYFFLFHNKFHNFLRRSFLLNYLFSMCDYAITH